jgi:hypothetical protein
MQTDMHFYGTHALALAAGLKPEVARLIATAAEYVDDSDTVDISFADGSFFHGAATGHHPVNAENLQKYDQRRVWIPFHFLPGNHGVTLHERLLCQPDSEIAREMVQWALSKAVGGYGPMMLGIAAHVYADTFAHYGFSGIAANINQVQFDSIKVTVNDPRIKDYILDKASKFIDGLMNRSQEGVQSAVANLLGLGHGGATTYPDRPFLKWSFTYSDGRESGERNNTETFLVASEKLHALFCEYAQACPDLCSGAPIPFETIRAKVRAILLLEADQPDRSKAWIKAMADGSLLGYGFNVTPYDEKAFENERVELVGKDVEHVDAEATLVFKFLKAANLYRNFVLNDLLPGHGITVFVD